jgi:peroxiredoxin
LAEFRDLYQDFRAIGVQIAAVAVDSPEQSERVRRQYELPFPILCDTEKQLIRSWGLYNGEERGGIAVPAVVLAGPDRRIRLIMIEGIAMRVRAADLVELLRSNPISDNSAEEIAANPMRQRILFPSLIDIGRAVWNSLTKRK